MGLFDKYAAKLTAKPEIGLSPFLGLLIALIYCAEADGEAETEEMEALLDIVGSVDAGGVRGVAADHQAVLEAALSYSETHEVEDFLAEITPLLNADQKLCILMNMLEHALADGEAEPGEQRLIDRCQQVWQIPDEEFEPYFRAILKKNDRSVLFE